jgi:hypothetical protein
MFLHLIFLVNESEIYSPDQLCLSTLYSSLPHSPLTSRPDSLSFFHLLLPPTACHLDPIRPEHSTGRVEFGPGQKTQVFRVEIILPMPVSWDVSGLSFRVGLGLGPGLGRVV